MSQPSRLQMGDRLRGLLPKLGPPLLFFLLSAIFLWQPILTRQPFLPTDLSFRHDSVWRVRESEVNFPVSQNSILSDVALYYYPYAHYAISRLQEGEFPLWNPYIHTGAPFFAATQAAVLEPVNLLTFTTGPLAYWTWAAVLRLAILGFGTFGFLRALGRSMPAALLGGVAFMVCGFVVVWLNYSVAMTLAWFPLLMWATVRLLQTGHLVWMAAAGGSMGALLLGGHPESQFLAGFAWGLFSLYGLLFVRAQAPGLRALANRAARVAGAAALGLGVGAVQTLTFAEFLLSSTAVAERLSREAPSDVGLVALRLATLLFPNFTGTPTQDNYWVAANQPLNFNEQTGYFGAIVLALGLAGAVRGFRKDRWLPFFVVAGAVSLLLAIRAPGYDLVRSLPLFNIGHGVRWTMLLSFCAATLAAFGIDAILGYSRRQVRDLGLLMLSGALAGFGLLLLMYIGLRDGRWDAGWQAGLDHAQLTRLFDPRYVTLYWPVIYLAAAALVVLACWRGLLRKRGAVTLLILLAFAELWTFGSRYNPVIRADLVYPENSLTQYLETNLEHGRINGFFNTLRPNVGMIFGIRDMRGYEDVTYVDFTKLYGSTYKGIRPRGREDLNILKRTHRLLSVASVKYMLTQRKVRVEGDPKPYRWLMEMNRVAIYENMESLPRARFQTGAQFAPNTDVATVRLLDPAYDPRNSVVITGEGSDITPNGTGTVEWIRDEPEVVELRVTAPSGGYLVLGDVNVPGWEATVDGIGAPILPADVVFRAVPLEAGTHMVRFEYRPALFYWGAWISGISTLLILAIAVAHLVFARTRKRDA